MTQLRCYGVPEACKVLDASFAHHRSSYPDYCSSYPDYRCSRLHLAPHSILRSAKWGSLRSAISPTSCAVFRPWQSSGTSALHRFGVLRSSRTLFDELY